MFHAPGKQSQNPLKCFLPPPKKKLSSWPYLGGVKPLASSLPVRPKRFAPPPLDTTKGIKNDGFLRVNFESKYTKKTRKSEEGSLIVIDFPLLCFIFQKTVGCISLRIYGFEYSFCVLKISFDQHAPLSFFWLFFEGGGWMEPTPKNTDKAQKVRLKDQRG